MRYSIIIPVYNRPDYIKILLTCLTKQSYKNFEVIVVEDGSTIKSDGVVQKFEESLDIRYIYKENEGQGLSRNRGMKEALGDYFIILDSDIVIPEFYMEQVDNHLKNEYLDAFGGPDRLHPKATIFQKAIDFCMTSLLTTGGTRGKKRSIGRYYPRSFNMGVSRKVYEQTKGFKIPFLGEDIEWSHRIIKAGFKTGLIENAYVNHARKNSLHSFYKHMLFFGRARINISQLVPKSFKLMHFIPIAYCLHAILVVITLFISKPWFLVSVIPLFAYNLLVILTATFTHKSIVTGFYSFVLVNTLMGAYTVGMIKEFVKLYIFRKKQTYKL